MRRVLTALRADIARYRSLDEQSAYPLLLLRNQGIWALACYRFSHHVLVERRSGVGLRALASTWQMVVEAATGISINPNAVIGRGFYIGHFSGIFIGAWPSQQVELFDSWVSEGTPA